MERPLSASRAGEVIPEGQVWLSSWALKFLGGGKRHFRQGSVSAGSSAGVRLPGSYKVSSWSLEGQLVEERNKDRARFSVPFGVMRTSVWAHVKSWRIYLRNVSSPLLPPHCSSPRPGCRHPLPALLSLPCNEGEQTNRNASPCGLPAAALRAACRLWVGRAPTRLGGRGGRGVRPGSTVARGRGQAALPRTGRSEEGPRAEGEGKFVGARPLSAPPALAAPRPRWGAVLGEARRAVLGVALRPQYAGG